MIFLYFWTHCYTKDHFLFRERSMYRRERSKIEQSDQQGHDEHAIDSSYIQVNV